MRDKAAICYETGLDESFLIGTREELRAFAEEVLGALNSPGEPTDYLGVPTESFTFRLTEVMADVVLDGILVVANCEDRKELINRIRINNREMPVDWETIVIEQENREQDDGGQSPTRPESK